MFRFSNRALGHLAAANMTLIPVAAWMVRPRTAACAAEDSPCMAASTPKELLAAPFRDLEGEWNQDMNRGESLVPFMNGLGVPSFMVYFLDRISTSIVLGFTTDEGGRVVLTATDRTAFFGSNTRSRSAHAGTFTLSNPNASPSRRTVSPDP